MNLVDSRTVKEFKTAFKKGLPQVKISCHYPARVAAGIGLQEEDQELELAVVVDAGHGFEAGISLKIRLKKTITLIF